MAKIDKNKPFFQVHGLVGAEFEQDGKLFDGDFNEVVIADEGNAEGDDAVLTTSPKAKPPKAAKATKATKAGGKAKAAPKAPETAPVAEASQATSAVDEQLAAQGAV